MNVSVTVHLVVQVASGVQARLRSVSVTAVVSNAVTTVAATTIVEMTFAVMRVVVTTVAVIMVARNGVNVRETEVGNAGGMTGMTAGNADAGLDPDRSLEDHSRTDQVQSIHHADRGLGQGDHGQEGHDRVLDIGVMTDGAEDTVVRMSDVRCAWPTD